MTIRRNQELTSKDDHHQPFFEEDGFQAHGVHSRTRTQDGFEIFSRDGWHYDSEQIELLRQRRRGASTETPPFSESSNSECGTFEGCGFVAEERLESYLIKCFPSLIFRSDQHFTVLALGGSVLAAWTAFHLYAAMNTREPELLRRKDERLL